MTKFGLLIAVTIGAFAITYTVVKHNPRASESAKRIERPTRQATAVPQDIVWIPQSILKVIAVVNNGLNGLQSLLTALIRPFEDTIVVGRREAMPLESRDE